MTSYKRKPTFGVSFSFNVPRTRLSNWLQPICQSKRPYSQTLHAETLSWGSLCQPYPVFP
jgi:hypothetical protein